MVRIVSQEHKLELLAEGKELVKKLRQQGEYHYIHRVAAVLACLDDVPTKLVSESAGVSVPTVNRWVHLTIKDGFDAIVPRHSPGRKPLLSQLAICSITEAILKGPKKYGYNVWDASSIRDLIIKNFGIEFTERHCINILHQCNLSTITPRVFPSKGYEHTEEREAFLKKLEEISKDPTRVVVFGDEAHFQIITGTSRIWALKGSRPTVKSFPGRANVPISGFVIPSTGVFAYIEPDKFDFNSTIETIRNLLKYYPLKEGIKYVLIMDGAKWHTKAKKLIEEDPETYQDIVSKSEILILPPYSPDFNPAEHVWRLLRRTVTNNVFFASTDEMRRALGDRCDDWMIPNEELKNLCTFNYDKSDKIETKAKKRLAKQVAMCMNCIFCEFCVIKEMRFKSEWGAVADNRPPYNIEMPSVPDLSDKESINQFFEKMGFAVLQEKKNYRSNKIKTSNEIRGQICLFDTV